MEPIDPERERQRLLQLYGQMADEELEKLAEDAEALTEPARKALDVAIKRRGLNMDPCNRAAETNDVGLFELEIIHSFGIFWEALVAKGVLESAGIEGFLFDGSNCLVVDNEISRAWWPSADIFTLQVKHQDAEAAKEILDKPVVGEAEDGAQVKDVNNTLVYDNSVLRL